MRFGKENFGALVLIALALSGCEGEQKKSEPKSRLSEVLRYDGNGNLMSVSKASWQVAVPGEVHEMHLRSTLNGSTESWEERVCKFHPSAKGLPMVEGLGGYNSLISTISPSTVASMGWPQSIDGLFCQRALGGNIGLLEDSYNSGGSNPVTQTIKIGRPMDDVLVQKHTVNLRPAEQYGYTDTVWYTRDGTGNLVGRTASGTLWRLPTSPTGTMTSYEYADAFSHNSDGRLRAILRHAARGSDEQWFTADDVTGTSTNYTYLGVLLFSIAYGVDPAYTWQYAFDGDVLREQIKYNANRQVLERWIYENY